VCNVATQPGETGSFSAAAHLDALFNHVGDELIDYALLNGNPSARRPEGWLGEPVLVDERRLEELPVTVIEEDLVDVGNAHRHDSAKLAAALMRLQQEERSERVRHHRVRRPTASAV
ncbi:MAG TPA: 2-phospho-L-lactate transferase CofD family protein, partial [Candidatus Limnocylindrales bacterium]|nr:2-phospho-L-lactate transferase CofD family protein [Candidatus Limnocylindrales bacterium]